LPDRREMVRTRTILSLSGPKFTVIRTPGFQPDADARFLAWAKARAGVLPPAIVQISCSFVTHLQECEKLSELFTWIARTVHLFGKLHSFQIRRPIWKARPL
jgi:hypothetical protein